MALGIREIRLTQIRGYWRNPRKNEAAVDPVMQSIQEYGFNQPLVLDSENVIVVGHTRYKAAKILELKTVPCVFPELTEEQAREYRIVDNKTNEHALWDMPNLIPELREILNPEKMQVYFGKQDLSKILDESVGKATTVITAKEIAERGLKMANKFGLGDKERKAEFLELICPHCAETYNIDREYVMELMGIKDNAS